MSYLNLALTTSMRIWVTTYKELSVLSTSREYKTFELRLKEGPSF